ncbi:MAG: fibronectin type III domain-containing protein [Pseudobdellovibrionaceae bacterium]
MTNFKNLIFVLGFLVVGLHVQAEEATTHETAGKHGKKPDLFPKKEADKTKATRVPTVELLEPKALSTVSGTSTTLKWKAVEGADSYRVQVATDPNFKWLVDKATVDFVKETSLQINDLQPGQQYFWRVYAWKHDADPSWSSSFEAASSFDVK